MSHPRIEAFYDALAPYYKLVYLDWSESSQRQASILDQLIQERWPGARTLLDLAAGVGTQAIGLARRGYQVTASTLSSREAALCLTEARAALLDVRPHVADMRAPAVAGSFDVALACDNAIPHLPAEADIRNAFLRAKDVLRPGGGYVISTRDYGAMDLPRSGQHLNARHVHRTPAGQIVLVDVWDLDGEFYDVTTYVIVDERDRETVTHVARGGRYLRIPVERTAELLASCGFEDVRITRNVYFQPLISGTAPR